jgi:hypothetical protein
MPSKHVRHALRLGAAALVLSLAGAAHADPGRFFPQALPNAPGLDTNAITSITLAPLGGGSASDLLVTFRASVGIGGVQTPNAVRLWSNIDGGFFVPPLDVGLPGSNAGAVVADFNGDGVNDAIVAGGVLDGVAQPTRVYRGSTGGSPLTDAGTVGPALASSGIAAADIDADGDRDLAIARESGVVDVLRNDSSAASFVFTPLQSLVVSQLRAGRIAFGNFGGDARPDLAALRPTGNAPSDTGLTIAINGGGATPFAIAGVDTLTMPAPADLAVADLNGDGWDDIVVADRTLEPAGPNGFQSASRVVFRTPQPVVDGFRFPASGHTAVAIADFDQDGRRDIVFARGPCATNPQNCSAREESTLSVWFATATSWRAGEQCIGEHQSGAVALAAGRVAFGALPDFVVAGIARPDSIQPGFAQWRNNASSQEALCCFAQTAAEYGEEEPAAARAPVPDAVAAIDLDALAAVRDELMAGAQNGTRLRDRYELFSSELVALLRADPTLWSDAAATLTAWSGPVRALVNGEGASATVTQPMVDAVDAFLVRIASVGSPALAQAIAAERALLPPFATFVGLDMNEFRAIALPPDTVFTDGFE